MMPIRLMVPLPGPFVWTPEKGKHTRPEKANAVEILVLPFVLAALLILLVLAFVWTFLVMVKWALVELSLTLKAWRIVATREIERRRAEG